MSVKHVKQYYNSIATQYEDMINTLKIFQSEAEQGLVDPDRVEEITKSVNVLKDNFQRWSYMMFLLNMPNKKEKKKNYEIRNSNFIKNFPKEHTADATVTENKEALNRLQ